MNKTESQLSNSQRVKPEEGEIGVGDSIVDHQRDCLQWTAIFFQGKFYLADPHTVSKLQEVQAEIEIEKKIATSIDESLRQKAESVREFQNKLNSSDYSCATEHNPEKSKLKRLRAEKELQRQQESNIKRLIQAKQRKNVEKKKGKNMIQVKARNAEEFVSEKQHQVKPEKDDKEPLNQSMMNKVNIAEKDRNIDHEVEGEVARQEYQKPQSPVIIDLNEQGKIKTPVKQPESPIHIALKESEIKKLSNKSFKLKQIHVEEDIPLHSYCIKIQTQPPKKSDQKKSQNISIEPSKHSNEEMNENMFDESKILKRVVIEDKKDESHEISILDLKSHEQQEINNRIEKERADIDFFNQINSKMYKLQSRLDGINKDDSIEVRKILQKESKQIFALQTSGVKRTLKESEVLEETKNLLKELNDRLDSMNFEPELKIPQKQIRSENNSEHKQKKIISDIQLLQNSFKTEKNEGKSNIEISPEKNKKVEHTEETPKPSFQLPFKKKKSFSVSPSIVNYQIAGSPVKDKEKQREIIEEKEKLEKQISVLQQVIGELRVERIKYQASQNYMSKVEGDSVVSGFDLTSRRPSDIPSYQQTHRPTGTIINNISESVVSEFQASRSPNIRVKSGKIVKNTSPEKKMTRIEEEKQIQQTIVHGKDHSSPQRITEQRQQSKNISEAQEEKINVLNEEEEEKKETQKHKITENQHDEKFEQPQIITEKSSKSKETQYKVKVFAKDNSKRRSNVSQPKSRQGNSRKGSVVLHEDLPLPNKSQRTESDLESSMPRALISKYNYSVPPKITIEQQNQHKKAYQETVQRNLMENFEKIRKNEPKISPKTPEVIDPKRRAIREGVLKNIDYKTSCHAEHGLGQASNIKQKIYEEEKKKQEQVKSNNKEEKSLKNFRMRRDSQSSQNSRMSNKSAKKAKKQKEVQKPRQNLVYVPALSQPSVNNSNSTPQQKDSELYQLQFKIPEKAQKQLINSGFTVKKREISFSDVKIPIFPQAPPENATVEVMVELIRKIEQEINYQIEDNEAKKIVLKKYKNCIMLDLPGDRKLKLVWHYNGKVYVGQWSESTTMKSGEGMEYVPEKYFYKGQFFNNKRNGTGIMIFQNGSKYEGQWLEGQKNGRGKFQDKTSGIYYEGEWTDGKRDGYGYLEVENRSIYEGTFSNNYLIGYGTQKFANGDSYKGEYQKGKFHGKGVYVWSSGSSYEGQFLEGKKHGEGKWKSQTGELYIGDYLSDKKHGFGRYKWENGCVYEGQFNNDRKHGKGTLRYSDGREFQGVWNEGQLVDLIPLEDSEAPLQPKKSKAFQTMTVIKVTETKPNKFSSTGRLSHI